MAERIPEGLFVDKFETQLACIRHLIDSRAHVEDSFYVIDLKMVERKFKQWQRLLPRVEMHYAVKCCDRREILEILASLGAGFDCASKAEISQVLSLGVDPSKIIFANPCKFYSHTRYAAEMGVEYTTFDSAGELWKIKELLPNGKLMLRFKSGCHLAMTCLDDKYGCDSVTEAPDLLKVAAELGLNVVGVSFHVGSGCGDPATYGKVISVARNLFDVARDYGHRMHILDIGGGFPGNDDILMEKMSSVINSALDEFFPDPSVRVVGEPGRFVAACLMSVASFIHGKRIIQKSDGPHYMYYVTCGFYDGLIDNNHDNKNPTVTPLKKPDGGPLYKSTIWGPTCDTFDVVCKDVMLPEMEAGDWVVFENVGAYSLVCSTNFNGFPYPKIYILSSTRDNNSKHINGVPRISELKSNS